MKYDAITAKIQQNNKVNIWNIGSSAIVSIKGTDSFQGRN
jgi:hypothetical protein